MGIRKRSLGAAVVAGVLLGGLLTVGVAAPAGATTTDPNLYLACGYGQSSGPTGCLTLPQALTDAESGGASSPPATIALMPGSYCPIAIPDGYRKITIEGVGLAGEPSGTVLDRPEAALSTFNWDSGYCGSSVPSYEIDLSQGYYFYESVTIENVAIEPGATGPQYGLYANNVNLTLRDDLFDNATDGSWATGAYYETGEDDYQLTTVTAVNDAFSINAVGLELDGDGSIDDSTISGNTTAGLVAENVAQPYLVNDTIADNAIGVDIESDLVDIAAVNTIVGDNYPTGSTTAKDCYIDTDDVYGIWEADGPGPENGYNLTGSSCDVSDPTDILLTETLSPLHLNGGPTPSIMPPTQASGTASRGACPTTDQREYLLSPSAPTCDTGSVQQGAKGTPQVSPDKTSLAFGTVDQGLSSALSFDVTSTGGDLVGTSSVSVTGTDFSLAFDGCTDVVLIEAVEGANSCAVEVSVTPTIKGSLNGEVTVTTTAATIELPLSATGGPVATVPGTPSGLHPTAGNRQVRLTWIAPTDGGAPIELYNVRKSTNSGTTWSSAGQVSGSPAVIGGLSNYTTYEFELQAVNAVGPGAWSNLSPPVTPFAPGDATTLKAPSSITIHYGKSTVLQTTLTDSKTSQPIVGVGVSLWSRPSPSSPFSQVATAKTTSSGAASITVTPKTNASYQWRFVGSSGHDPAASTIGTVLVAQVVSVTLTKSSVKAGSPTVLYGTVSPNETGQTVVLEEFSKGQWSQPGQSAVIKRQRLPSGTTEVGYEISFSTKKIGAYVLRVERAATASNAAGFSKNVTVDVT